MTFSATASVAAIFTVPTSTPSPLATIGVEVTTEGAFDIPGTERSTVTMTWGL